MDLLQLGARHVAHVEVVAASGRGKVRALERARQQPHPVAVTRQPHELAGRRDAQVLGAVRTGERRRVIAVAAFDAHGLEAEAGGRVDAHAVVAGAALHEDALEVAPRQLELGQAVPVEVDAQQVRLGGGHGEIHAVGLGPAADHEALALDLDGGGRRGGSGAHEQGGHGEGGQHGLLEEAHGSVDGQAPSPIPPAPMS